MGIPSPSSELLLVILTRATALARTPMHRVTSRPAQSLLGQMQENAIRTPVSPTGFSRINWECNNLHILIPNYRGLRVTGQHKNSTLAPYLRFISPARGGQIPAMKWAWAPSSVVEKTASSASSQRPRHAISRRTEGNASQKRPPRPATAAPKS